MTAVSFDTIFAAAGGEADATLHVFGAEFHALTVICLLLFVGAMGKSAQLGLHTWLPDAMEGPTPVSALIHAATMVTAGVFMVARLSPLFEYSEVALAVVTIVGALDGHFCGDHRLRAERHQAGDCLFHVLAAGLHVFRVRRVGVLGRYLSPDDPCFLQGASVPGAGSVIHAMSDEQDMRRMGGIWKMIPTTYVLMWIGSLALAGVFPFAGYFSKDIVIEAAYGAHTGVGLYAFWLGVAAAFLTAFYSWRLLLMTFHGKPRADEKVMAHVHELPMVMIVPLMVLAVGRHVCRIRRLQRVCRGGRARSSGAMPSSSCRNTMPWRTPITCRVG